MRKLTKIDKANILLASESVVGFLGYNATIKRNMEAINIYTLIDVDSGNIVYSGTYTMIMREVFSILLESEYFSEEFKSNVKV